MRAVSWLLGLLAVLIVAAVLAVWLVPPMLDWTRYRGEIIALASGTLGRSVRIDGPISLTILPEPVLTAAAVSVDEGEAAISVRRLRLRVALWPLLRGRLVARDLVMREFDMRVPWPMTTPAEAVRRPDWLAATSARIERGRVSIGDLVFTDIDADLATGAASAMPSAVPAGGYAASGTARFSGKPWHFSVRMSPPGGDGSVTLDVALDGQGPMQGVGATLAGQIEGDGSLGGRVTARGPDLAALLPAPAVPFKADGRLTIAGGLAAADSLVVEIGGSPATGAVALRVSPALRLDVALAASRLDLDAWLPTLLGGAGVPIPTGIDLSAEAAQLAGGTLRHLRGAFDIDQGRVEVRDIKAMLPGDAAMQLSGRITHPDPARPHFEGDASLAAPALRTTLAWLEGAGFGTFSALPDGVLRSAELAGHTLLDRDQLAVGSLRGKIDGMSVAGTFAVHPGRHLALGATLQVDRVDLDRWLPATIGPLAALPARLSAIDADVRLEAGEADARGIAIKPFALDARIDGGQVNLRRLEGQADDVHAIASGTLVEGGRIADGRLDVQASLAEPLADMLSDGVLRRAAALGGGALLRLPLTVQIQADGAPDTLGLRIKADLGDLKFDARPTIDATSGKWAGLVTLRHPGAPRLAEMLGVIGAPAWLGDGSLALVAQASGEPHRLSAESFDITAGALHASGRLALETGAGQPHGEPHLSGKISAETLPLPLPYPRAPEPIPLGLLGGWSGSVALDAGRVLAGASPVLEQVAANVSLADRTLRIDRLTARLGGGAVSGAIVLNAAGALPVLSVSGSLTGASVSAPVFDLPMDITAGTLDASAALTANGFSPAGLLATLRGDVGLSVRDGQILGFDLAKLAPGLAAPSPDDAIRQALAGGTTPFATLTLTGHADHGDVVLQAGRLSGPAGEATASGVLDLPDASADIRIVLRPALADPPEIGLRLTGPLDAPRRTPELAGIARWRVARINAVP
jgi:uncharacterized protein involved in outer membrane biogenesis